MIGYVTQKWTSWKYLLLTLTSFETLNVLQEHIGLLCFCCCPLLLEWFYFLLNNSLCFTIRFVKDDSNYISFFYSWRKFVMTSRERFSPDITKILNWNTFVQRKIPLDLCASDQQLQKNILWRLLKVNQLLNLRVHKLFPPYTINALNFWYLLSHSVPSLKLPDSLYLVFKLLVLLDYQQYHQIT